MEASEREGERAPHGCNEGGTVVCGQSLLELSDAVLPRKES